MRQEKEVDTLNKLSGHLHYEFWMLGEALNLQLNARDQRDINVAIESFSIHARVLVDFLFMSSGRETDVLAVDYLDDRESWLQFIDDKKCTCDYVRFRTGKEIAHLTIDRLNIAPEAKKWDCVDIHKKLLYYLLSS